MVLTVGTFCTDDKVLDLTRDEEKDNVGEFGNMRLFTAVEVEFPADLKSADHQAYIFFEVSGLGIPSTDRVNADCVRRRHFDLPTNAEERVEACKYLKRMKLSQSRTHSISLRLGPPTVFAYQPKNMIDGGGDGYGYDVVMRKVSDIKPSNDEKKTTDGAGLIGSVLMKHIITDYQNQNPDTHV